MALALHTQHEIRHSLTELRAYFAPMWRRGDLPDQAFAFLAACASRIERAMEEERHGPEGDSGEPDPE